MDSGPHSPDPDPGANGDDGASSGVAPETVPAAPNLWAPPAPAGAPEALVPPTDDAPTIRRPPAPEASGGRGPAPEAPTEPTRVFAPMVPAGPEGPPPGGPGGSGSGGYGS